MIDTAMIDTATIDTATIDTATFRLHTDPRGVLVIDGEVDLVTAPLLRQGLREAADSFDGVVLDMSGVTFFSSAGVDVLTAVRACDAVSLLPPPASVSRVFDILGWPEHVRIPAGAAHA